MAKDYARGHWARVNRAKPGPRPLPPPEVDDEELDDIIDLPDDGDEYTAPPARPRPVPQPPLDDDAGPVPDPEPAHLAGKRDQAKNTRGKGQPIRITASVRKDINAKLRAVTYPGARMWAMRDQYCGTVAVQQEPEIADALTDIICDSPDLVAWFTGPAGGFMKFFRLFMACLPVATMAYGHHWKNTQAAEFEQAPDYSQYAA